MANWKMLVLDEQNIEHQTLKAVLIKLMPKNSKYANYKFWHNKCFCSLENNQFGIRYTDDFTFKVFKTIKLSVYNRIIDQIELTAKDFEELFSNQLIKEYSFNDKYNFLKKLENYKVIDAFKTYTYLRDNHIKLSDCNSYLKDRYSKYSDDEIKKITQKQIEADIFQATKHIQRQND